MDEFAIDACLFGYYELPTKLSYGLKLNALIEQSSFDAVGCGGVVFLLDFMQHILRQ